MKEILLIFILSLAVVSPSLAQTCTPTTYTLTVTKSGTGSGTITGPHFGVSCTSNCTYAFNSGTTLTLTATADSLSTFTGWSGACSGTGSCTITIGNTTSVGASFSGGCSGDPVKIGSTTYSTLQAAYSAASPGDTIKVQGLNLYQSLTVNRNISVTLAGGYDCAFTSNSGRTTSLKGTIQTTAGGGTLTIGNVVLANQ